MEKTNELKKRLEKKLGGWVIILPVDAPLDRVIVQYGDKQVNYIGKIIGNDDLIRVVHSERSLALKEGIKKIRKIEKDCTDTTFGTMNYDEFARRVLLYIHCLK